jgi:hypothetical protein
MFEWLANRLPRFAGTDPRPWTTPSRPRTPRDRERNLRDTARSLRSWGLVTFVFILAYAISNYGLGWNRVIEIMSQGTLMAIAFGGVGTLLGFLFGIPRTLQSDAQLAPYEGPKTTKSVPSSDATLANDQSRLGQRGYRQTVNTNLEQISDWLTKILVGVGLTQMQKIPDLLKRMAGYFAPGLHGNAPIALGIIINSSVLGFFVGYLLTRLFLASAFGEVDALLAEGEAQLRGAQQYAKGLTEGGEYEKAISTLEAAVQTTDADTPPEGIRKLYESLVYNYLYVPAPRGFQKAVEYGESYCTQELGPPSSRIWAYLAAAYGQQYKWEQDHENRLNVLDALRKSAHTAVKTSLDLEPKMKPVLRALWDKNDVTKEQGQEDDLEVFYEFPEFKAILE